jgi:hypothetical protein
LDLQPLERKQNWYIKRTISQVQTECTERRPLKKMSGAPGGFGSKKIFYCNDGNQGKAGT